MNEGKSSSAVILIVSVIIGLLLLVLASVFLKGADEQVTLPVKVEEFSDFQCPACKAYYSIVNKIIQQFTSEEVNFVFKNFPLTTIHHNAYKASIAAEAAREQGKFMEFHDLLFERQDDFSDLNVTLSDDMLLGYAQELQLDLDKFKADLAKPEVKARVDADIAEGNNRGVSATPTFFVNGRIVVFKASDDIEQKLLSVIQEKIDLAKKQATVTP